MRTTMDQEIEAFVSAWFQENAAVVDEVVALQGDNPASAYGAALAAAMATVPPWSPKGQDFRPA